MTCLQAVIVEIAWAAVRHEDYLRSLYDRHVTRNSGYRSGPAKGKAIVTVAHAILVIISLDYLAVSDLTVTRGYGGINLLRCG